MLNDKMNAHNNSLNHSIAPIFDEDSSILVLGSFPSVKSRDQNFYYANPQNRFWRVLASVFQCDLPISDKQKTNFLINNKIALWDVVKSCEIIGSSDSSISNVVVNDFSFIFSRCEIKFIIANGSTCFNLYKKYCNNLYNTDIIKLPSTSPANAATSFEMLVDCYKKAICG